MASNSLRISASIEVKADPSILKVVSCLADPDGVLDAAVCDVDAESGKVRLATVSAAGLTGRQVLGQIVFERVGDPKSRNAVVMTAKIFDPGGNPINVRVRRWR